MKDNTGRVRFENGQLVCYCDKEITLQVGYTYFDYKWYHKLFNLKPKKVTKITTYNEITNINL